MEPENSALDKAVKDANSLTTEDLRQIKAQLTAQKVAQGEQIFRQCQQALQALGCKLVCVHEHDGETIQIGHRVVAK